MRSTPIISEPEGCWRGKNFKGRWFLARVEPPLGSSLEKMIHATLLPWTRALDPLGHSIRLSYDTRQTETTWTTFVWMPPRVLAHRSPRWLDRLGKALRAWNKSGRIGLYNYDLKNIEADSAKFGGSLGLRLYEEAEDLSCRLLLNYAERVGTLRDLDERPARAVEWAVKVLEGVCPHLDPPGKAALLKRWLANYLRTINSNGFNLALGPVLEQGRSYARHLKKKRLFRVPPKRNGAARTWNRCLSRLKGGLVSMGPRIARAMPSIRRHGGFEDWVGRRLLHYNFIRFYSKSLEECVLTAALAELLEKNLLYEHA